MKVNKYKPKQENVIKLKEYLAYITKTQKNNCYNINSYGNNS